MINALWLVAIGVALYFQSTPGLLALLAVFTMEIAIDLKALRAHASTLAQVFTDPAPATPPEHDKTIASAVVRRIRQDARRSSERVH